MTVLSRAQAGVLAQQIRVETIIGGNTPDRVGTLLQNMIDSAIWNGEAVTPPTAGNGLTGTSVFSVLPNGATLDVSASGVRIADIAANSVLGRAGGTSGAVAAIAGTDGQAFRVSGSTLGFGTLATAAYADASVTTAKILDANVTLAKMANIVTDSLVGRDTAGTGVPENITLNATMSMTGAGALQRAALTGAVSASAGSNTTAFASGAFGALPIVTSDSLTIGSATLATTGDLRTDATFSMTGWNSANSVDTNFISWTGATPRVTLGSGNTAGIAGYIYLNAANIQFGVGTNIQATLTTTTFYNEQNTFGWSTNANVTAPILTQADATGGSAVGKKLTLRAQLASGATSTGGAIDVGPGSGTSVGGLGRLMSGSAAARVSWNDTGYAAFGATPAAQPADMVALTAASGSASTTINDVTVAHSQTILNDNFKSLATQINSVRTALRAMGHMA